MLVIDVLGLKYIMTLITNKDARRNEQKETKNGFVERKEKEKKNKERHTAAAWSSSDSPSTGLRPSSPDGRGASMTEI